MENENLELVSDLRELADFLASTPGLPKCTLHTVYANGTVGEWGTKADGTWGYVLDEFQTRTNMREYARMMKPCKKDYVGGSFSLKRSFGSIMLQINTKREAICQEIKTGEVIHHEEYTIPARTEEVVEWVCNDPLLASSK